ncbi:MAG: arginine--tRNA ligase, partial [Clostridia bacterium]|nr:arginine--tRNA ligase [Clostridia bacterium]
MSINQKVRNQISQLINGAVEANGYSMPNYIIEVPKDRANGDFSANVAMLLSKEAKMAPRMIAEKLVADMDFKDTYIEKIEVAGPGFINFYLSDNRLYDVIADVESMGERYGSVNDGQGKKVMVEFVSANPTGPMHMGNARGGALGDSMAAVLDFAGYDVTREFY